MRPTDDTIDYGRLAEYLGALAYPARLELLRILRFPHLVSDIRIQPARADKDHQPDRVASKQAIQAHLDKLVDLDLVRAESAGEGSRNANLYCVNGQQVYAFTEDLRKLSTIYAGRGTVGDATGTLSASVSTQAAPKGPRLVLVHGLYEGQAFPLADASASQETWTIGRRRGLAISLDYDPFVSLENTLVRRDGARFIVEDMPGSKNGTSINWEPIRKGGSVTLEPADVIGVGRSLLVFRPA
jgi:hypothetical protein